MGVTMNKKEMIGWIITILCTAAVVIGLKGSSVVTWEQTLFVAITLFYILVTAFELLDNMLIAILLPATYLFFKLAPAATIYAAWSNNVVWLCVSGMIIGNVLGRIGLLKRLVFWCVLRVGSKYRNVLLALGVAAIVINIIAPSGGYIIFAAVVAAFCQALNLQGTKTGAGLMLAASLSCVSLVVYSPSSMGLVAANASAVYGGFAWDYVSFFVHMAPQLVPYFAIILLTTVLFKEDVPIDVDVIRAEYDKLGRMSLEEKKGLAIAILFVVSIMTTNIHKIGMLYCFIISTVLFYLPGIKIGAREDITKVGYSLIFFIAAFIAIGSVATATQFTSVVSQLAISYLGSVDSLLLVCVVFFILAFVFNFLMTPLAMYAAFITPLTQVAVALSIPVYPAILSFVMGSCQSLLPYEIAKFLVFYAFGMFTFKDFAKYYGTFAVLTFISLILLMVPYWKLIGLA